jgi:SecD/SecF fusion protein
MRENTHFMKKETYGDMVDLSIRQTMVRSVNTTVALLLPLVAILAFGGPTLKDFAMALTIGVVAGTYSSFFVAAPLVVIWKEREPRYRKRLAAAGVGGGAVVEVDASVGEAAPAVEAAKPGAPSASAIASASGSGKPGQTKVSQRSKKGKTSKRPPGKKPKRTSR